MASEIKNLCCTAGRESVFVELKAGFDQQFQSEDHTYDLIYSGNFEAKHMHSERDRELIRSIQDATGSEDSSRDLAHDLRVLRWNLRDLKQDAGKALPFRRETDPSRFITLDKALRQTSCPGMPCVCVGQGPADIVKVDLICEIDGLPWEVTGVFKLIHEGGNRKYTAKVRLSTCNGFNIRLMLISGRIVI